MPILHHFGLQSYPFGLTPDCALYYATGSSEAILASLEFALLRGDGLVKVVGEVGSGKTLLCRLLLRRLTDKKINTAYINAPLSLTANDLAVSIGKEFGLKDKVLAHPVQALRDYLLKQHADGQRCVLVIDEAQALGRDGLETVRLLSNLETDTHKLLQIVLFGQPELQTLLEQSSLRQMLQRISFAFRTQPLGKGDVEAYLHRRLEQCVLEQKPKKSRKKTDTQTMGGMLRATFAPSASRLIARASGGIPRLVNMLADKAMIAAYTDGLHTIDVRHVRAACRETQGLRFPWSFIRLL